MPNRFSANRSLTTEKPAVHAKKLCHLHEEVFNNMDEDQERDETFIYEGQGFFA